MKRAWLLLACGALSACWAFDTEVERLCLEGSLTGCPEADAGEPIGPLDGGWDIDAGLGDSGTPDDAGTDDGGVFTFCKGAWCWQHPRALPGVGLAVIWGTSDDDVFVAGGSGVTAHFNGTSWRPSRYDHPYFEGYAFIQSMASDSAGRPHFCGREMRAVAFDGDAGFYPGDLASQPYCVDVDAWDGGMVFLSHSPGTATFLRTPSGGTMPLALPSGGNIDRYTRARFDNAGHVAVVENGNNEYFIAYRGSRSQVVLPDGGAAPWVTALERDPDGDLRALAYDREGNVFSAKYDNGNNQWAGTPRSTPTRLWAMTHDAFRTGSRSWLYAGAGGFLAESDESGPVRPLAELDYALGASYAVWQSPQGTLWAAGEGGQVLRVTRTPDGGFNPREVISHEKQPTVQDLWVRSQPWIAAGDTSAVWTWTTLGWQRLPFSGPHIIALVNTAPGIVTLREDRTLSLNNVVQLGDPLPALEDLYVRVSGLDVLPDGGVLMAWGDSAYASDLSSMSTLDGGLGFSHATDLAVTADGVGWVSAIQGDGANHIIDGGVSKVEADGSITRVYTGQPVYAVAPATDGGVFAAGLSTILRCAGASCEVVSPSTFGRPVSLWVDAKNRVWVLDELGHVCWGAPFDLTCDPAFWSGGDYVERLPTRIRGTADRVFVVGGFGNIISRPLPP